MAPELGEKKILSVNVLLFYLISSGREADVDTSMSIALSYILYMCMHTRLHRGIPMYESAKKGIYIIGSLSYGTPERKGFYIGNPI